MDLLADNRLSILREVCEGDALIGRFGHHPKDLQLTRPIFDHLERVFHGRNFPSRSQYFYYDDKLRQWELFKKKGYAIPPPPSCIHQTNSTRFCITTVLTSQSW